MSGAAFGGQSPGPTYAGGGNLWRDPDPPPPLKWWQWIIQAVTFDLVRF